MLEFQACCMVKNQENLQWEMSGRTLAFIFDNIPMKHIIDTTSGDVKLCGFIVKIKDEMKFKEIKFGFIIEKTF